jgi:hypothetical protein
MRFLFYIYFLSHKNMSPSPCSQTPPIYFQATRKSLNAFSSTNVANKCHALTKRGMTLNLVHFNVCNYVIR